MYKKSMVLLIIVIIAMIIQITVIVISAQLINKNENVASVPSSYKKIIDREKYQIWRYEGGDINIKAVYKDIAIAVNQDKNIVYISQTGIKGAFDKIVNLNHTNFPNLINGSLIEEVFILPWTRNRVNFQDGLQYRVVIVTNRSQIYHNFPTRGVDSDGDVVDGDIAKFDESVIWDLPERKFPSVKPTASGTERYFPGLANNSYIYYPAVNVDNGYGNGGFDKAKTVNGITYPRFYIPNRGVDNNSFMVMGGYEPGDKLSIIGTYRTNNSAGRGARTCIFATDDGGRQWYCKYEFADQGVRATWVNSINTSAITKPYTADSFQFIKKTNVYPTAEVKEPKEKFIIGSPVIISNITKEDTAVVTTLGNHGLVTGNIIAIQHNAKSSNTSPDWDWMRNDTISAESGGNGVLFQVEVVDNTHFKLHEEVHSAYNNLAARHIHAINRIKDGFIISTGEVYPEGWILFAPMKESDSYSLRLATSTFPVYRLNSANTSIQRSLGTLMYDDPDNTIVFASDTSDIIRSNIVLPSGRTEKITRNSTGVFKGKLADVDDFSKFTILYEAKEVAYFFKEIEGVYIYVGQRGECGISFDKGSTWDISNIERTAQYFNGKTHDSIVLNDFIFVLK